MFDIGMTEMLVIAVLAVVVVGPKDLPKVMRTMARAMAKMRGLAREFQSGMSELAREAELGAIRDEVEGLTKTDIPVALGSGGPENVIDPGVKPEPAEGAENRPETLPQSGPAEDQEAAEDSDGKA